MRRIWIRARDLRGRTTDAENKIWSLLRGRQMLGLKFRRQHPVAGFIADFVRIECRLIVELDGGQHIDRLAYDQRRDMILQQHGYTVMRFWNDEALLETDAVLAEIFRHASTPPQPSPENRGGGRLADAID